MVQAHDVVVIGGGVAGSAAALALARANARVLVIDAGPSSAPRIGESIPPDTRAVLAELGVWDAFRCEGHAPCFGSASTWGEGELGYNDFVRHPLGHGWHLDRARFDRFLRARAEASGAEVRQHTRWLGGAALATSGYRLRVADANGEHDVDARFVIDATGRRAHFARSRGARRLAHDQLLCSALGFTLPPSAALGEVTLLEAVEYGWWYAARLPDNRAVAAVTVEPSTLRALGLHTVRGFHARLSSAPRLGSFFRGLTPIADAPELCVAASCLLAPPAAQSWAAVGDAAATYDPLSSLGIYKALVDGLRVAPLVTACLAGGGDGSPARAYVQRVAVEFTRYAAHRQRFYALETRFRDAPFWRARRARTRLVSEAPRR